ncbi:5'-nucleotidase [Massilia psychrophila]|jgi:5'-nucleotidase|uniref:5'-nucleotidase n=1 Tax=Massilia psychrophila TaxID=1603353 RepID=A0A2G8T4F1_9BURK|nr:5'-nucleotidase [Massilia psychrophila]PIL40843.1 5'-nucleotidase [Massilia psychrophila]GGE72903.1 5'-nucleotidase [Massilia psychrophila]
MPFQIEHKLVIGVASSALFDLTGSHQVYLDSGPDEYRNFQERNLDVTLGKGVAFPFIRRFLSINKCFPRQCPVEVVLFSRNSPETGLRVMRSIAHYGLDISRAAFMTGTAPYPYLPAFNTSLFLSANEDDVTAAIAANYPAGLVLPSRIVDDDDDVELRVAFDFDGVIADDEAESVFKQNGLDEFHAHEAKHVARPHQPGPLADMFQKLALMQRMEERMARRDSSYRKVLRIAIITARSAPSHERVVTTLKSWGVSANETFFLGGMDKARVLAVFKPHIFFDDQLTHLTSSPDATIPMVHVPFGIANRRAPP